MGHFKSNPKSRKRYINPKCLKSFSYDQSKKYFSSITKSLTVDDPVNSGALKCVRK